MNDKKTPSAIGSDVIPSQITGDPVIGLTGDREITVDGFRFINDYSENSVAFCAGKLTINVIGCGLMIRYISPHTIVIAGGINSVEFQRGVDA